MGYFIFVVYLLTLLTISELRSPQVYEQVDETPILTVSTTEEPNANQTFNYSSITQQDRQKWRYLQQQAVDARNQARNKAARSKKNQTKSSTHRKRDLNSVEQLVALNHALTSIDNMKFLEQSAHTQKEQIRMLNSLLGKAPLVQLQGLQQMLNSKDHTPITEEVIDISNPLNYPNVKVEPAPPEYQEAVANSLVLQADAQRQLKEQYQIATHVDNQIPVLSEEVRHLQDVEHEQMHPTYGRVVVIQSQPKRNSMFGKTDNLQYASEYAFGYKVRDLHSGNDFGHEEVHNGKSVKGHYHVLLPDGRLQHVQYWADHTGYHAKVTYDKVATHPIH